VHFVATARTLGAGACSHGTAHIRQQQRFGLYCVAIYTKDE
jgi:hypothetical protein